MYDYDDGNVIVLCAYRLRLMIVRLSKSDKDESARVQTVDTKSDAW